MQDSNWYYESFGAAKGPITTRELIQKIHKGELTLVSLVFKEGEEQWFPVQHFSDITDMLGKSNVKSDADWVVLRSVEVDGKQSFEQIGPFNAEQVLQLVEQGKIKFSDHVWRAGFENWVPLGRIDEFEKPLASSVEVDLSLYQMPKHEMIQTHSVDVKKFNPAVDAKEEAEEEEIPPEAEAKDLAKPTWILSRKPTMEIVEEKTVVKPQEVKAPLDVAASKQENKVEEVDQEITQDQIKAPRPEQLQKIQKLWQTVAIGLGYAFVAFGIILFGFWAKHKFVKKEMPMAQTENYPETPPPIQNPIVKTQPPTPIQQVQISPVAPVAPAAKTPSVVKVPPPLAKPNTNMGEEVMANESVNKDPEAENISKLGVKERSFYYNRDRKFIFYTSQKGAQLAAAIETIYKKQRNAESWNKEFAKWKIQVKAGIPKELKRSSFKGDYMFPETMNELKLAFKELIVRSNEMNTSLVGGRGPSRDINMADIIGNFRDIGDKAKRLNP